MRTREPERHSFASDNNAPIHADVLRAIESANHGHVRAYGDDPWTHAMEQSFREHFGPEARAHCVFGGTGANVLGLQALLRPFEAVICARGAHIDVDECGAPERYLGSKLIGLPTPDGKLTPEIVEPAIYGIGDQHHVQARVIAITQASEVGTLYTPDEIRALSSFARARDMYLHMDGARLSNAAVGLGVPFRALTTDAGVDVLSFGGTKNGLMGAEAVVFLRKGIGESFHFQRKQGMQLASKMRFVACQLSALLGDELWKRNAAQANAMARLLATEACALPGVRLAYPVQANGVFAHFPPAWLEAAQAHSFFYVWDPARSVVRWMCSFDTREEDVRSFVGAMRQIAETRAESTPSARP
jgi:threonine aldolase